MVRQVTVLALVAAALSGFGCADGGAAFGEGLSPDKAELPGHAPKERQGSSSGEGGGGDLSEAPVDPKASPAENACTKLAYAQCKAFGGCDPVGLQRTFGDAAGCNARLSKQCNARYADPGAGESADKVEACAASIATLDCAKYARFVGDNGEAPAACAIKGTLAAGASCVRGGQCASGACSIEDGKGCGACVERVALLAACTASASCPAGATCADGKCVKYGEVGATCDLIAQPCADDLACIDKKCAPRIKEGAPCTNFAHCEPGLVCNGGSHVCEKWSLGKVGEPCGLSAAKGFVGCVHGAKCKVTDPATYSGSCVAAAKVGEPCAFDGPVDSACEELAVCVSGKCVAQDATACK